MKHREQRRRFLQTTAAAGIGFWVAGGLRAQQSTSPNERIAFACIGVGGKGLSDSTDADRAGDVVAICDVDENTLNGAGERYFPKAKRFTDFRKLLAEMGKSIDAVTVSTPDHTHAAAALMAMRLGKHCYCQKPLTRTIYEARLMARVARAKKLATQMGNQGTASKELRKWAAFIHNGGAGAIREVHVWTNRPWWPQGGERPKPHECPKHVHWDEWLGPAPQRPFANGYHPFAWRGWWDFGCGALGDMACHTANLAFMALDLRDPLSVQAETAGHNKDSFPKWSVITFEFPERNGRKPVRMVWYDGGKRPPADIFQGEKCEGSGALLLGEKLTLYAPGDYNGRVYALGQVKLPPITAAYPKSPGHFAEFARAIRGGEPAMSNFPDYGGPLTETILLGNLAVWAAAGGKGEKALWDAQNLKCTNIPGLEPIIKPSYRGGYTLEA